QALVEALALFETNGLESHPQDHARATYAPKLTRDTARIRWTDPAERVAGLIRGLDPRPGAWSELDGREGKLVGARAGEGRGRPGGTSSSRFTRVVARFRAWSTSTWPAASARVRLRVYL